MTRSVSCWVLSAAFLILCFSQASAEPFETIVNNGNPSNRVDIAIIGDGYTASEQQKYKNDVQALIDRFFNNEPFLEYKNFFNVHRVDVVSSQSGADHPERSFFVNTALDSTYNCNGIQRLICVNLDKTTAILGNTLTISQRDMTWVIVNDPEYGGSGGFVAVTSTNVEVLELILHELGHSFGLLADEYGGPPPPNCENGFEPAAVNVTKSTVRSLIKWNHWIDASTPIPTLTTSPGVPGLYEGAMYCDHGLYRPTFGSKMRFLGVPYEQINTEQLVKRFYDVVSPIDSSEPTGTDIGLLTGQSQLFSVSPLMNMSNTITVNWFLDGVFQTTGTGFTVNNLTGGAHVVEAVVKDNTPLVRKDTENLLTDNRKWNVTVNAAPSPTPTPTPTPTPAPTPILLIQENSTHAAALESVILLREPFSIFANHPFSPDGRTRVMLFATNVELQAGDIVTAQAEDSQHTIYQVVVEYVGKVPGFDWLTQLNMRFPDNMANAGDVLISIKVRGVESNKVPVSIRPP